MEIRSIGSVSSGSLKSSGERLKRACRTFASGWCSPPRPAGWPACARTRWRRTRWRAAWTTRAVTFEGCDADFQGPGAREVVRVIFVTALLVRDAVHSRARKVPPQTFARTYQEILGRYRVATAKLVLDAERLARVSP